MEQEELTLSEVDKREEKRLGQMRWSVQNIWNKMLQEHKSYSKVRDYISPSDIGKNYWDRYQKMMGIESSNPYTDRVLRIFSAGDEFHNLIKNVFKASGIFINSQDDSGWSVIQPTEKTLKLLGKYDVLAGGKPNIEQVKDYCNKMGFSQFIKDRTIMLAETLLDKYPDGMPNLLYEIKSINSLAFWNKRDYLQDAYPFHKLQCFAYMVANNIKEGRVLYISKDDLTLMEFAVHLDDVKLQEELKKDLEEMSHYILTETEPPKPPYVVFNERGKIRFQKDKKKYIIDGAYEQNWEVSRSPYFKLMTGFNNKEDWEASIKEEIHQRNDEIKSKFIEENLSDISKGTKEQASKHFNMEEGEKVVNK
jgi:hypothetical protein